MDKQKILQEVTYKAVRSGGAGGQHVNKVASKVELYFHLNNSEGLDIEQKELLLQKLATRLNKDGILVLKSDSDRSQFRNKENVTERLFELLEQGLIVPKVRKKKKVPRSVIEKRLQSKRDQSVKKENRRKPNY